MQYKIQTAPIIDAIKSNCGCPFCQIERHATSKLVDQYLNEAVMVPEYRIDVNAGGFCQTHLAQLFAGENKLGLALQLQTRTHHLLETMPSPTAPKQAKRLAQALQTNTCVICRQLALLMERYSQTTASMFAFEEGFVGLFGSIKSLCLRHYALLLEHSEYAKSSASAYLSALHGIVRPQLASLEKELEHFAKCYDYRSETSPSPDTLPKALKIHTSDL